MSAIVPIVAAQCDACGYISGVAAVGTRGPLPRPLPRRFELRFHISNPVRRFGLALVWVIVAAWIVWADYLSLLHVSFPVSYILPVLFAANSGYQGTAFALSLAMPLGRLSLHRWGLWTATEDPLVSCVIQAFVLGFIALLADRRHREVRRLRRLLRVCAWCKSVHVQQNTWQAIEAYIAEQSGHEFTHGLCPICAAHFGERLTDTAIPAGNAAALHGEADEESCAFVASSDTVVSP